MARVSAEKRAELESFWRHHHEGWKQSTLNQREYCELHGLPLKRFGNWRDQFKAEDHSRRAGLLYRRGGLRHMPGHMSDRENAALSTGYIPAARSMPDSRRNFRLSDKKRIVAEAMAPGASVSLVARRYGISKPLLFRWKRELAPPEPEPIFLPVTVDDGIAASTPAVHSPHGSGPIIIERSSHEIEIELAGGRRVRFARDTDPAMVRAMIVALEGAVA